jgi:O-antigen ligase
MIIPLTLINKKRASLIIILVFALLLTKSMSTLLSILLGLAVYFYFRKKFKKREIVISCAILMLIVFIFMIRAAHEQTSNPIYVSALKRLSNWEETIRIIKAHPITGVGLGNFNIIQTRYAHNFYLQIWAEAGILGVISFLWIIATMLRLNLKAFSATSPNRLSDYLFLANIIFLIHNFFEFSIFLPEVSLIWWAIFGLLISELQKERL